MENSLEKPKSRENGLYRISDTDLYQIRKPGRLSHLITVGGKETLDKILSEGLSTQHNGYSESFGLRELAPSLHVTLGDGGTGLLYVGSKDHPAQFSISDERIEEGYGLLFNFRLNEEILKFMERVDNLKTLDEQQRDLRLWHQVVTGEDLRKENYEEAVNFMKCFYGIHVTELEEILKEAPEESKKGLIKAGISNLFYAQEILAHFHQAYARDRVVSLHRAVNAFPFNSQDKYDDGKWFMNYGIRPMTVSSEKPCQLRGLTIAPEYIESIVVKEGKDIHLVNPEEFDMELVDN